MGLFAFILGGGVLLAPNVTIKTTTLPSDLFIYQVWASIWTIAGAMIIAGVTKLSYTFVRIGLGALMAIYSTFAIAQLIKIAMGDASLFGAALFMLLSLISMSLLFEPPINPVTAVKSKDEE